MEIESISTQLYQTESRSALALKGVSLDVSLEQCGIVVQEWNLKSCVAFHA